MSEHFYLNGQVIALPKKDELLIDFLRQQKNLKGTKAACREGDCGSCQILVGQKVGDKHTIFNSQASCLLRMQDLIDSYIITIEGLQCGNIILKTLSEQGASQCGYCSPGLVMGVLNWLLNGEKLDQAEGYAFINANLCRCTGYMGQKRAIKYLVWKLSNSLSKSQERFRILAKHHIFKPQILSSIKSWKSAIPSRADNKSNYTSSDRPYFTAGGTDLALQSRPGFFSATSVLKLDLDSAIKTDSDYLYISARHPLQFVNQALKLSRLLTSFSNFTEMFASAPIRHRATLGGNIANASPIGDGICYFFSLNAILETNQRIIPIQDFFIEMKETRLQEDEIIEWIRVPQESENASIYFDKVSRRGTRDIATVNCCSAWFTENGRIEKASITVGGASAIPVRLTPIEKALAGFTIGKDIEPVISKHVDSLLSPISDLRGSAHYRLMLAKQLITFQWKALARDQQLESACV